MYARRELRPTCAWPRCSRAPACSRRPCHGRRRGRRRRAGRRCRARRACRPRRRRVSAGHRRPPSRRSPCLAPMRSRRPGPHSRPGS
ncbi:MAG: hypothetical protein DMD85_12790 [Candidatus Rokuibacteriota bacterium]|nr:MAG: hypothetical protein DMD85_12790 [Candidatus Rokubacteria bacterium]